MSADEDAPAWDLPLPLTRLFKGSAGRLRVLTASAQDLNALVNFAEPVRGSKRLIKYRAFIREGDIKTLSDIRALRGDD